MATLQVQKLGVSLLRQADLEFERFVSGKGMWNSVSSQARTLYYHVRASFKIARTHDDISFAFPPRIIVKALFCMSLLFLLL